jgi:acetyl-CoA carboxylase biotin carboxylase subunit
VDSAAYRGWTIPPDYDSLLAKVVSRAPTRKEAIRKMQTALEMTIIVGIKTNIPLHLNILSNSDFKKGNYTIQFLENYLSKKIAKRKT